MQRQLKISSLFAKRKYSKHVTSPKLTLSGKWFEQAGFNIGDTIKVEVVNNQLIISK